MLTPLDLVSEMQSLLSSADGDFSSSLAILDKLKESLEVLGYKRTAPTSDYTSSRSVALNSIAKSLLSEVSSSKSSTYSDKAYVLSSVGDMYLRIAHAFKVDTTLWSSAQSFLVPLFYAAIDEESVDKALVALESHIVKYIDALAVWL